MDLRAGSCVEPLFTASQVLDAGEGGGEVRPIPSHRSRGYYCSNPIPTSMVTAIGDTTATGRSCQQSYELTTPPLSPPSPPLSPAPSRPFATLQPLTPLLLFGSLFFARSRRHVSRLEHRYDLQDPPHGDTWPKKRGNRGRAAKRECPFARSVPRFFSYLFFCRPRYPADRWRSVGRSGCGSGCVCGDVLSSRCSCVSHVFARASMRGACVCTGAVVGPVGFLLQ